jgi:hypothetical protein
VRSIGGTTALVAVGVAVAACSGNASGPARGAALREGSIGAKIPPRLPAARGHAFYVATNGSDSGPGTLRRPWRTVQRALNALRPGQRVYVRGGTYVENLRMMRSGTRSRPIAILGYRGEHPVLRADNSGRFRNPFQFDNAAYVRLHGFTIEGSNGIDNSTNVYAEGRSHDDEVSGNNIRGSQNHGVFTDPSTSGIQVIGNRIHDNGTIDSSNKDHAIYVEGRHQLIANNVIYNQRHGHAVQIYPDSDDVLVVDNTIVGTSFRQGYRAAAIIVGGDGSTTADHTVIVNNIVAFNDIGIYGYFEGGPQGTGNVAYGNVAYGNRDGNLVNDVLGLINFGAGNIVANPHFANVAAHNFRLLHGSAALDRAVSPYSTRRDYAGVARPQGRGPDVGAFERRR